MNTILDKLIEEEQDFITRKKDEVTTDFPVIQAEIRLEVLEKVKRLLQEAEKCHSENS